MHRARKLALQLSPVSGHSIPNQPDLSLLTQDEIKQGVRDLVPSFASFKPEEVSLTSVKGGITNTLWRACAGDQSALVRIYGDGTDIIINRQRENQIFAELTEMHFGIKLLAMFKNGRIEEWFENARTLEPGDLADPVLSKMIAGRLAEMHQKQISGVREPVLFRTLYDWLRVAQEITFTDKKKAALLEDLNLKQKALDLDELRSVLLRVNSPVVFAHNDLLAYNVMYHQSSNRLEFVDLEYGEYNYRGFDIGNHFCEFAGFDYSKIEEKWPNKAHQYNFFVAYLQGMKAGYGDDELDKMFVEVSLFSLASHFFWGLWALVQAKISVIDFDYLSYSKQRFDAFYIYRDKFRYLIPK